MVLKGLMFVNFYLGGFLFLKGLTFNDFHFARIWWSRKE